MRVVGEDGTRAFGIGDAGDDGQRLAQPVELVHRRAVEVGRLQAAVHALVGEPQPVVDGALQLKRPAGVFFCLRLPALLFRQRCSQGQRLVVADVG